MASAIFHLPLVGRSANEVARSTSVRAVGGNRRKRPPTRSVFASLSRIDLPTSGR